MEVAELKAEVHGAPPTVTVQPLTNEVPLIVMAPPRRGWEIGVTLVTIGGVTGLYVTTTFVATLTPPSGLVTTTA